MSTAILLKIFSDCCILFAIVCAGPITLSVPALIPALICAIAAGLATYAEDKGWTKVGRLCALLPMLCLLLPGSIGEGILFLIPAVYTAVTILRGDLALEYSEYRYFFVRSLGLLAAVYVVAGIWNYLIGITDATMPRLNADATVRYSVVHLLCGVVLQRQLRLGVGHRAEGGRRQMATLLGTAGTVVIGFLAAEPLLRRSLGDGIRLLISLILLPIMYLVDLIGYWIINKKSPPKDPEAYEEYLEHLGNMGFASGGDVPPSAAPPTDETVNLDGFWVIPVAILLLIAAGLLLHSFRKRRPTVRQSKSDGRVVTPPKKKRTSALSNRGRVRQLYREFLRTERDLGMQLKISHTSGDVLEQIHKDTDRDSAARLRQVYLAARYDERQNVDKRQLEKARRALKGTRTKSSRK
jgi:hypothetical protein